MRCPRCGAVLRDDAEQCGFCGERIVPAVSFEKPIIENRPRDEAFDVENTVHAEVPEQQNHDQNPIVIAIILLSGVLMAAVGILLFYAFKNSQRAVINVNPTTTEEASQTSTTPPASVPDNTENAASDPAKDAEATEPASEEAEAEAAAVSTESVSESGAVIQTVSYDDREYDGIIYRFSGNQAIVLKCQGEGEWIELPAEVDGAPLIGISEDAFNGCTHLVYIDLPEGVAWIGARAFMNCTNLKQIVMPDTLVTVGDGSFNFCPLFTIVSHDTAYGHTFADYHSLNWLEGESLVPME